jgi:hypothetical protein
MNRSQTRLHGIRVVQRTCNCLEVFIVNWKYKKERFSDCQLGQVELYELYILWPSKVHINMYRAEAQKVAPLAPTQRLNRFFNLDDRNKDSWQHTHPILQKI